MTQTLPEPAFPQPPGAALAPASPSPSLRGSPPAPGSVARPVATAASGRRIQALTGRQKAAILVRLLLEEGADIPLATLPEDMQTSLTEQMAQLRLIDRDTLASVVREFVETLEQVGLSFSGGIEGALTRLGDRLSPAAASRLRQIARAGGTASPWDSVARIEPDTLLPILARESAEVAAVVLSKLETARAAALLGQMPGERARRVACAMPLTESIAPSVVARIGEALLRQIEERPRPAFTTSPGERFGAILNAAPANTRDSLLRDLESDEPEFAESVRKNIFTFAHIPARIARRDVPRILREVPQDDLITALTAALAAAESPDAKSAEFLLENMSQRLAASLRDEIAARGKVRASDAETAQTVVTGAIRSLLEDGEITMKAEDEEEG